MPCCCFHVAAANEASHLGNRWGEVFDLGDPILVVLADQIAADANLYAAVLKSGSADVALRVPLNVNLSAGKCISPLVF